MMRNMWFGRRSTVTLMKQWIYRGSEFQSHCVSSRQISVSTTYCGCDANFRGRIEVLTPRIIRRNDRSLLKCQENVCSVHLPQSVVNTWTRCLSTSAARHCSDSSGKDDSSPEATVGQITPKLALKYKCKVCSHENLHTFSRNAYESGVVIVQCQSCSSRHLIADNLGWFADHDRQRSVKGLMESQGQTIKTAVKSTQHEDGTIEIEAEK